MARRKSKKPQQEDTSILLESSVPQSKRRINSLASPVLLSIIIFTVVASVMGWFCVTQQHGLDELSQSFTTMERRISNLQQVMVMMDAQTDTGLSVEERIFALEEGQKQAQERAEVALATSEKLKNSNLYSQIMALHDEMDTRLAEVKQVTLSVTTLQALFKNQSEEFEAVKEGVEASLSSSSALSESVAWLTRACSRIEEQFASVEALNEELEGQAAELDDLKKSMHLHGVALHTNNQEIAAIKELVKAKLAMRSQALEEMLSSVQMIFDEQFSTSQTLHSSIMSQLQTFHTQLVDSPQLTKLKSNEENVAAASAAAQNGTEVQDVELKAEQLDADDEAEEEETVHEEQPVEQEVTGEEEQEEDLTEEEEEIMEEEEEFTEEEEEEEFTEEEEEEITEEEEEFTEEEDEITEEEDEITEEEDEITEEEDEITEEEDEITEEEDEITEEEEEITGQSEEQEVGGETAQEEEDVSDEPSEEELSEEGVESWETAEEESSELNNEVSVDDNEEDE